VLHYKIDPLLVLTILLEPNQIHHLNFSPVMMN
jgi:hypothetical protein